MHDHSPPAHADPDDPDRTLAFEALFNFRDLGGYPGRDGASVVWRRLFRADGLHRATESDGALMRALNIATVIDLRTPAEVAERGRFPAGAPGVEYHHLPLFDVLPDWTDRPDAKSHGFLARRYAEMLDEGGPAVAAVMSILARPQAYPAVFHCAAGKDRTGIVAAIVLGLLGVDNATIVADYALSHTAMAQMDEWVANRYPELVDRLGARPRVVLEAHPTTMEQFLVGVGERFGSFESLAAVLGIDQVTVDGLRANLLAQPSGVARRLPVVGGFGDKVNEGLDRPDQSGFEVSE